MALDDWLVKLIEEEAQSLPAAVAIECSLGLGDLAVPSIRANAPGLDQLINNCIRSHGGQG